MLRVALGIVFLMHGWLGLMVMGPTGLTTYITRLGYPTSLSHVFAWYLIVAHLVGGALLIIGLWTRIAAIAQIPIMAAATFQLRWWQGFFLKALVGDQTARTVTGGYEYDFLVFAATCALALLGPGRPSIDARPARRPRWADE